LETQSPEPREGSRSPLLAAFLSFLWPGLGQLYAGHRRLAAVLAAPAILAVLLLVWELRRGLLVFAARMLSQGFALEILIIVILVGVLRALAVGHAFLTTGAPSHRRTRPRLAALTGLLAVVVVMHSCGAFLAWSAYDFDQHVFAGNDFGLQPDLSPGSSGSGPTYGSGGTLEPGITPLPGSPRVTIFITGVDSAPGRTVPRNDLLLVVSVDTLAKTVAMLSVPRDTASFPLYWAGSVSPTLKINALETYVRTGQVKSPDDPMTTLTKEISFLVGIPINYYAELDLAGFAHLIDMVGGVDIDNPSPINDPYYDWLDGSPHGFQLSTGPHHLNGRLALAYVRSRRGPDNSVYVRDSRQEEVLVSLEKRLATPDAMAQLPSLLQTVSQTIRTNFPADQIPDMVALGEDLTKNAISQYVLGPPYSLENATPTSGIWTSCLRLDKVAQLSVNLFGQNSSYYGKTEAATCGS